MDIGNYETLYAKAEKEMLHKHDEEYLKLIINLAEQGYYKAQIDLGWIYSAGFYGLEKNIDLALKWHLEAHKKIENAENCFLLGELYETEFEEPTKTFEGCFVTSNHYYSLAFKCFKQRAEEGETKCIYRVGEMCSEGLGTARDEEQRQYWYDKYYEVKSRNRYKPTN